MRIFLSMLVGLAVTFAFADTYADHHAASGPMSRRYIPYPCSLNEGVVPKIFDTEKFNMGLYIREAVAVAPPYEAYDMRWLNYFSDLG